jgi:L-fucose isomerase-like protein
MILRRHRHEMRPSEATRAREKAEADLERIRAETPMYAALGRILREIREENHIRQHLLATFKGGTP